MEAGGSFALPGEESKRQKRKGLRLSGGWLVPRRPRCATGNNRAPDGRKAKTGERQEKSGPVGAPEGGSDPGEFPGELRGLYGLLELA